MLLLKYFKYYLKYIIKKTLSFLFFFKTLNKHDLKRSHIRPFTKLGKKGENVICPPIIKFLYYQFIIIYFIKKKYQLIIIMIQIKLYIAKEPLFIFYFIKDEIKN